MNKQVSINSQLIKLLTLPLIIFTLIIFLLIYYVIQIKVTDFFDNRLYATAQSISDNIGVRNNKLIVDLPNFSIDLFSSNENGFAYYSIVSEEGVLLIGHDSLFDKSLLTKKDVHFYDAIYDTQKVRVLTLKSSISSSGKKYNAFITVGETKEERNGNIQEALILLLAIMSIVIIGSISITILAVRKGLNPLKNLKNIILKRDKRDIEPLVFNAPKEIEDVVNSINILFSRTKDTIDYIEQFNADVSHQLRTPLTEMTIKLEILNKNGLGEYHELNDLVNNMSHITEQLLLYAKTNPSTINLARFQTLSLNKLCKEYSIKTAPRVYERGFEFAFENMEEEVFIQGDSILLESMLDNIINNALHYALDTKGEPMGTITLYLERHNNTVWLSVKDEGLGLEKEHLKNIFKRFYRVDSNKRGSGLGLSIVQQIATLHQAEALAVSDNGLGISIIFKNKV